jgi:hypothetical protein
MNAMTIATSAMRYSLRRRDQSAPTMTLDAKPHTPS